MLRRVEASKDINILPYSEPPPPTNTSDYPDEFIASVTSSLRLYRFRPCVGTLSASIEEPKPLVYSNSISTSATETTLRISLEGFTLNLERLQRLSIRIKSGIRAKTFYSAIPITCMPNQSDLALKSLLRLHDDVMELEEQRYGKLEWEPSWSTSLRIRIAPAQALPPSFCSVLVARSYSLITRVSFDGMYMKDVDFEMPLQVIYPFERRFEEDTSIQSLRSNPCQGVLAILSREEVCVLLHRVL